VMECDPGESEEVENEAAPEFSVAEPIWFLPSLNATLPVAVAGVTNAVKVTLAPEFAGLTSAVKVVEVVAGEPGPGGGGGGGAPGVGGGPAAEADEAALPPPHPMEKKTERQRIKKKQRTRVGMEDSRLKSKWQLTIRALGWRQPELLLLKS